MNRRYSGNKKADISARKIIFYAIFGFAAAIVFLLILWLTSSKESELSAIPSGVETYLTSQRFLNSPLCFALQDSQTERTQNWVVDLEKFNQEVLDKCYKAENTKVNAYKLTLAYGTEKKILTTKNWEGFFKRAETKKIMVYDGKQMQNGELLIEVQDAK